MIQESYFKNNEDIYHNIDLFESGQSNVIFVVGFSGSGKSTISGQLAEKYNAEHINLDTFSMMRLTDDQRSPLCREWVKKREVQEYFRQKVAKKEFSQEYMDRFWHKVMDFVLSHAEMGNKYIIEGIQIFRTMEMDQLVTYPLVIKGTSFVTSILRRYKRDGTLKRPLPIILKYYMDNERDLRTIKDRVKQFNLEESAVTEACKDVETARKFVREVDTLAKKYDANYFIVTDGASGTSNRGNPAVKNARQAQIEWEKKHGFDPDHDWSNESAITEALSTTIPDDISQFINILNSEYQYGAILNGRIITGDELEYEFDFYKDYKSLTLREFEKYKTGVCWDYTHYEAVWFKAHRYKYDAYYLEATDKGGYNRSHTFLVFYLPGSSKAYYFESAWGQYKGIEEFNSTKELLNTVIDRHLALFDEPEYGRKSVVCTKYDATSKQYEHIGCADYMIKASGRKTFLLKMDESAVTEYGTTAGTVVGTNQPDSVYIVNYMQNNVFSGTTEPKLAICKTGMKDIHVCKDGKVERVKDADEFDKQASKIKTYKYTGEPVHEFDDIVENAQDDIDLYRLLTGKELPDRDFIAFDVDFVQEECFLDTLSAIQECVTAQMESYCQDLKPVPILMETVQGRPYNYYRDLNGVFIQHEITGIRSKSYDRIEAIPEAVINTVKKGYIL